MKTKQKGFTLVELLVVIAIIGLLSSVVLLALTQARIKSRDAKRQADIKQVIKGMELYFSDNASYPKYLVTDTTYTMDTALAGASPAFAPNYVAKIPIDPGAGPTNPYQYVWTNTGKDYGINVYYEFNGFYCKYMTPAGNPTWFSSSPTCTK